MVALTRPSFVSTELHNTPGAPAEETGLQAVDVYKTNSGSVVVNGYQEQSIEALSLLDSVKAGIASLNSLKPLIAAGAGALKTAAQISKAYSQIKSGNIFAAISGVSSLAGVAGVGGVMSMASQAMKVVSIYNGKGDFVSKSLGISGAALGSDGAALTKLAADVGYATRQGAGISNAISSGNITAALNMGANMGNTANRVLNNLDQASKISFQAGYASVDNFLSKNDVMASGMKGVSSVFGAIDDVITSITGEPAYGYNDAVKVLQDRKEAAAMVAGATYAAAEAGNYDAFDIMCKNVKDPSVTALAAYPLIEHVSFTGDLDLFDSLVRDASVTGQVAARYPDLPAQITASAAPSKTSQQSNYASDYAKLETNLKKIDPQWDQTSRAGTQVITVKDTVSNSYISDMQRAKVNTDTKDVEAFYAAAKSGGPDAVTIALAKHDAVKLAAQQFEKEGREMAAAKARADRAQKEADFKALMDNKNNPNVGRNGNVWTNPDGSTQIIGNDVGGWLQ